jgi:hypothetical protein
MKPTISGVLGSVGPKTGPVFFSAFTPMPCGTATRAAERVEPLAGIAARRNKSEPTRPTARTAPPLRRLTHLKDFKASYLLERLRRKGCTRQLLKIDANG